MNFNSNNIDYLETRLKITPSYALTYTRNNNPNSSRTYYDKETRAFLKACHDISDADQKQLNSLANLELNKHTGTVSSKAVRRLYTAFDWLLLISRDKWATNLHNRRDFKFKLNLITLTLPAKQIMHKYDTRPINERFWYRISDHKKVRLTNPMDRRYQSDLFIKHFALNNFFTQLRTKHNLVNYVWKAEKQKNGNIHFHIVTDKYFDIAISNRIWNRILDTMGYIQKYRENQKDFHKNGFRARPELFKHWNLKSQIEAYKSGCITQWSNPHGTFDVHSLKKIRNAKAYLAKYLTKNPDCYREFKKRLASAVVANKGNSLLPDDAALLYETVKKEMTVQGNLWYISQSLSKLKNVNTNITPELYDELERCRVEFPKKFIEKDYCTIFALDVYEFMKHGFKFICDKVRNYIIDLRNTFYPPGTSRYADLGVPLLIFDKYFKNEK